MSEAVPGRFYKIQRLMVIVLKFQTHTVSDKMSYANSADPGQTAPEGAVWSGSTLFTIPWSIFRTVAYKAKFKPKKCGIKCSKFFNIYEKWYIKTSS